MQRIDAKLKKLARKNKAADAFVVRAETIEKKSYTASPQSAQDHMRIRARLLFLGLSILIPAALSCAVAVWFVYSEQQKSQQTSLEQAVKSFSLLVDKNFLVIEGQLSTLAKSNALANGDLEAFTALAKRISPTPDRVIVLSTIDGQQIVNTRALPGAALPQINAPLLKLRSDSPHASIVSDLFIGAVARKRDGAVDVPVTIGGVLKYRLSMGIGVAELQRLIKEQSFPSEWIVSILDRNGVVVSRSRDPARFVGAHASEQMLQRIRARESHGINYGRTLDGQPVVAFFVRSPDSGWTTVLSIPQSEMRKPALYAAKLLAAVFFVLLCLAIGAARYFAGRTAAPIERLREAAELMGEGKAVDLPVGGLFEIDAVGEALKNASILVRKHNEVLEERIAEAVTASEIAQRALLQAQKLEALGRLTGGVSHDFNNILQTLTSCLQILRMTTDRERVDAVLSTGEKAIKRATELTAQMRSFARQQDVRLETADVGELISTIAPLLTSSLHGTITLNTTVETGVWLVKIDRLQFELALLNIAINARDAMPRGGELSITVQNVLLDVPVANLAPGSYILLKIADQGTGMSPAVLAKALDPFFTTKGVNQGSGLGLAQAYGFATQANGTLVLESVEGQGTTVLMYLPRAYEPVSTVLQNGVHNVVRKGASVVLFVEDDDLVRDAVGTALEYAGYTVIPAISGEAALAALESGISVDVVFSDVVMPGKINGVDLAKVIRQTYPSLRIVLASGHADLAIDLPDVQLIGKPYDVASVINLLDSKA